MTAKFLVLAGATSALIAAALVPSTQASAAPWRRALNPQPLPPGLYAPNHRPGVRPALNPQPLPPGIYSPYFLPRGGR